MTDSEAREFIENKKEHYINYGYDEEKAEALAYSDLERYLEKNNLKLEF